jgi:hypothetical protein
VWGDGEWLDGEPPERERRHLRLQPARAGEPADAANQFGASVGDQPRVEPAFCLRYRRAATV